MRPSVGASARTRILVSAFLLVAFSSVLLLAQQSKADRKAIEAQAKQLMAEGKALEKQGKLSEARDKYVDSEAVLPTNDVLGDIRHVDEENKNKVEKLLDQAHTLFEQGKFSDTIGPLQEALVLQPSNSAAQYDLALSYTKLSDRGNAALHLEGAIAMVPQQKERAELLAQHTATVVGTSVNAAPGDLRKKIETFNQSFLQEDPDPGDSKAEGGSLCEQAASLRSSLVASPAALYNAAKCAEQDGRPGDAAQYLVNYAKLAPQALDLDQVQQQQQSFASLAALQGDDGQAVREHYANAARYLDYRRYDRAIAEYQTAEKVDPDYADTQWRLALLFEASGKENDARQHLTRFEQLESDEAKKAEADAHLQNLDGRRAVYEANIDEAQYAMTRLLRSSLGISSEGIKHRAKLTKNERNHSSRLYQLDTLATQRLPEAWVQRELERARADLDASTQIFPLGPEANELLALISLQGNDWPSAYRSYDAVASQGFPVSFYAQVSSSRDRKAVRATKVEVGPNAIRLVYLSSYDPRKQISVAPPSAAGDDDLGNLVVDGDEPPDPDASALSITPAELKGIQTELNFVVLKLPKDTIYLAPVNLLSDAPFEGAASRSFGNEYTRLFVRYLGYEDAKLGKEGMTAGEKFKLGFEIAQMGASIGMSFVSFGAGAPAAYSAALQTAQIVHALSVLRTVSTAINIAGDARAGLLIADKLQTSLAVLQRTTNDQRAVIAGMTFKVLPEEPPSLKFRDKF